MNTWLNYFLEANAGLLLFLLVYRLLLQHETQFTFKRIYLLSGIVFSLTFPLITVPDTNDIVPSIGYTLPAEWTALPVLPNPETLQKSAPSITSWQWIAYGYLVVVVLLILRFLYQVIRVLTLLSRGKASGGIVTISDPDMYAFSFFRYIFISNTHNLSPEDQERIIRHESVHIKKWHSVDMLLIEVVKILFWFNPLLKYYKMN